LKSGNKIIKIIHKNCGKLGGKSMENEAEKVAETPVNRAKFARGGGGIRN